MKQASEIAAFCKDFFNFSMRSRFSIDDSGAMVEFAMPAEARGLSRESSCGSGAPNLSIGGGKAPAAPPRGAVALRVGRVRAEIIFVQGVHLGVELARPRQSRGSGEEHQARSRFHDRQQQLRALRVSRS